MSIPPLHVQEGVAGDWQRWFAWHPAMVDQGWTVDGYHSGRRVWWRWIERRRFYAAPWFLTGNICWWEYRELIEKEKQE